MLTLTDNAATVVKTIAEQASESESTGLRITTSDTNAQELNLSVVPAPELDDQVVENAGARVFLEPGAAVLLDDKILDAQVEENGAVTFAVATV